MTVTPVRHDLVGLETLVEWLDDAPHKYRYEVVDGAVVVSPPPSAQHERSTFRLGLLLEAACPPDLLVVPRFGWAYDHEQPQRYLEPDLAVIRRDEIDPHASLHHATPLLVVETASFSTRRFDEGAKRDIYAAGAITSYWLLDPVEPRLRILELNNGAYVETGVLESLGELTVERPFPVTLQL